MKQYCNPSDLKSRKIYLLKNNIDISNKTDGDIFSLYDEIRIKNDKKGREERLKKLELSGKYEKVTIYNGVCKYCNKTYEFKYRKNKVQSFVKNGYCSIKCYSSSGELEKNRIMTYLTNKQIIFDKDNLYEVYSKTLSEMYRFTDQSYRKNMNYKENGLKGKKTKHLKFLLDNNILNSKTIKEMTDSDVEELFLKYFNIISKHGEKIKEGLLKKHNSKENVSNEYRRRFDVAFKNFIEGKGYDISNISTENFSLLKKEFDSKHQIICDTLTWKKSHLKNRMVSVDNLSNDDVSKLYSEYLSDRRKVLSESIHNGYRRIMKGWYTFKYIENKKIFYRSSWELIVLRTLDNLIDEKKIIDVNVPKRVEYEFENKIRHYFPDVEYVLYDGTIITCEIKPSSKLLDGINVKKFESASQYYDNFYVITEHEIFSDDICNFLLERRNDNEC